MARPLTPPARPGPEQNVPQDRRRAETSGLLRPSPLSPGRPEQRWNSRAAPPSPWSKARLWPAGPSLAPKALTDETASARRIGIPTRPHSPPHSPPARSPFLGISPLEPRPLGRASPVGAGTPPLNQLCDGQTRGMGLGKSAFSCCEPHRAEAKSNSRWRPLWSDQQEGFSSQSTNRPLGRSHKTSVLRFCFAFHRPRLAG